MCVLCVYVCVVWGECVWVRGVEGCRRSEVCGVGRGGCGWWEHVCASVVYRCSHMCIVCVCLCVMCVLCVCVCVCVCGERGGGVWKG